VGVAGTGVFDAGTVCAIIGALIASAHANPTTISLIFAKTRLSFVFPELHCSNSARGAAEN
jgi:hypothetical protein